MTPTVRPSGMQRVFHCASVSEAAKAASACAPCSRRVARASACRVARGEDVCVMRRDFTKARGTGASPDPVIFAAFSEMARSGHQPTTNYQPLTTNHHLDKAELGRLCHRGGA